MATPRLFRLKSEVIAKPVGAQALEEPIARIWVDTGVDHLDAPYDYFVPQELSAHVLTGVRVQVSFGNREVEGIVIERLSSSTSGGVLKPITKVLSKFAVATTQSFELFDLVAKKFASSTFDVLRSAIPPRVAGVEKNRVYEDLELSKTISGKNRVDFIALPAHIAPLVQICANIDLSEGSNLLLVPDERDLSGLVQIWNERNPDNHAISLGSSLTRGERYSNFLDAINIPKKLVVGTRSAIFAPVASLSRIIIYRESSPDYFEQRSPGANVKDVALLRAQQERVDLSFLSYVTSLAIAHEIYQRRIKYRHESERVAVRAFTPMPGQLLPERIFAPVREALRKGPVLFLVTRKGYANALLCGQCKNFALCSCGGRLKIVSPTKPPLCSHCAQEFPAWRCAWCKSDKQYAASRGIDRASEEIGRAFPNIAIVSSSGDSIKDRVSDEHCIVVATPGASPIAERGYSAVVILNALSFFSHDDLAAGERARELLFETSALVRADGQVLIAIDDSHPVVAALTQWSPATMIQRELRERAELNLAPFAASAYLRVPTKEATQLATGLRSAISSGRLNSAISILGPVELEDFESKIVLQYAHEYSEEVAQFLRELQRKRGIAKKSLLHIRINPYSLA